MHDLSRIASPQRMHLLASTHQKILSRTPPVSPTRRTSLTPKQRQSYCDTYQSTNTGAPFEMASACIEIETTRDIARQFLRHRSFSFQEFSQRYADVRDLDDNFVLRKARLQDPKNRQNSVITDDVNLHLVWEQHQRTVWQTAMKAYNWAIDNGIAKEQARAVLPEGNTLSKLYCNGTIRSWIHYIELRSANGTQLEHMELAREIAKAIAQIFPGIEEYVQ